MKRKLTDRASSSSSDTYLNQAKSNRPKLETASSVADLRGFDYEVFLSFRGQDTRKGFTSHLYTNLKEAGIRVFLDDERLHVGEEIGGKLLEAISRSKICIPIFSKNYASSKWCLKEAAHMVKCRNQLVLPIFYDVTPHEVKHQSKAYEEAFNQHSERYDEKTVREWRNALSEIGALKGWEVQNVADGYEGEIVKKVVSKVWRELNKAHLIVKDSLVGVEDSIKEVTDMLQVGGSDVRMVGIYGIGGIGKTTLAKIIYNQLLEHFDYSIFLKDIRQISSQSRGLEKLQTQLVSDILKYENLQHEFPHVDEGTKVLSERFRDKKVLILLDDVDKEDQINALAADLNWFAGGSIIIITTRDKSVLNASQVTGTHEVRPMHFDNALLLFCMHAFKRNSPEVDYVDLSEKIVATTGGLPLALEVIGSLLYEASRSVWEETFEKLQNGPCEDVHNKLRISYETLQYGEKQIFLDIACFFIGMDKRIASYMWKDRKLYPESAVKVLLQRSLIKVGADNKFWMHDQLRDFGREIVRKENISEPSERSRLWSNEDVRHMLENQEGTKKIEAIQLDCGIESKDYCFTGEQFKNLQNLRFLRLVKVNVAFNSQCFLRKLSWLEWHYCPVALVQTSLYLENLVILDLSKSNITDAWSGWSSRQLAIKLKVLILESCQNLHKTPDLFEFKSLERLSLGDCRSLHKVDPSIAKLKNLTFLSLRNCISLTELPQELSYLQALVELDINGSGVQEFPTLEGLKKLELLSAKECRSLYQIPPTIGHLTSLLELSLGGTRVSRLPDSIGALVKLRCLSLRGCRSLKELPNSIGELTSLKYLCLSSTGVHTLPDSIGNLTNLQVFLIKFSKITYLPKTLGMLKKLEVLDASGCKSLWGKFLIDLVRLCSLTTLKLGGTNISMLWLNINGFPRLKTLNLINCDSLQTFSQLPSSLLDLSVTCRSICTFPDLSACTNLLELRLIRCSTKRIRGLGSLIFLRLLKVSECENLAKLDGLEKLESIRELSIKSCRSLLSLPNFSNLKMLRHLIFEECRKLHKVEGLEGLESLECLNMQGCLSIENSPDLYITCRPICTFSDLSTCVNLLELRLICSSTERIPGLGSLIFLRFLNVSECKNLARLDGVEKLESMRELSIISCESLLSLPNLSNLKMLRHLTFEECRKLHKVEGLEELESLERLNMQGCISIENLPDMSKLGKLKELVLVECEKLAELKGLQELKSLERVDITFSFSLYIYYMQWPHIPWDKISWESGKRLLTERDENDRLDFNMEREKMRWKHSPQMFGNFEEDWNEMEWDEKEWKGEQTCQVFENCDEMVSHENSLPSRDDGKWVKTERTHQVFENFDEMESNERSLLSRNALEMEWDEKELGELMLS